VEGLRPSIGVPAEDRLGCGISGTVQERVIVADILIRVAMKSTIA
jgi:hypothetical protein